MDTKNILKIEYIAGFFDGEGSVGIYKGAHGHPQLRVQIGQRTDSVFILEMIKVGYGGHISYRDRSANWQIQGRSAQRFLQDIVQHLILKKTQAELAIEYQDRVLPGNNVPLSKEELEIRLGFAEKLKSLKRFQVTASAS